MYSRNAAGALQYQVFIFRVLGNVDRLVRWLVGPSTEQACGVHLTGGRTYNNVPGNSRDPRTLPNYSYSRCNAVKALKAIHSVGLHDADHLRPRVVLYARAVTFILLAD